MEFGRSETGRSERADRILSQESRGHGADLRFCAFWLLGTFISCGCQRPHEEVMSKPVLADGSSRRDAKLVEEDVKQFCGACHPVPQPEEFPRDQWQAEVQQGYDFYLQSSLTDIRVPAMTDVLAYFEVSAPEHLELPESSGDVDMGNLSFEVEYSPATDDSPALAHLAWRTLREAVPPSLVSCDMREGAVKRWDLDSPTISDEEIVKMHHPSHAELIQLDGLDECAWIIADLGSFSPADHDRGTVVALACEQVDGQPSAQVIHQGVGRISDVQVADLDSDADQDLVVAEFGWRRSGSLFWLESKGGDGDELRFEPHPIDERHGVLFAPVVDFNKDGRPDIVAAYGQEHESVDVFYNLGQGEFRKEQLFRADTPAFGMNGIEVVDLDSDGDDDIVFINGDMFDDYNLRLTHAIHWLENCGHEWRHQVLYHLPGVSRTKSIDIDNDGDIDVLGCALIPHEVTGRYRDLRLVSLVCLEQTSPGQFLPHVLEIDNCHHAALEAGDFDRDGDVDLAVGNFNMNPEATLPDLSIWWNKLVP
jgi:FG-GAP-like repeat